jgi:hypothetical protein
MNDEGGRQSFWTTLPGILTGIAGVLGAVAALIGALVAVGIIHTATTPAQPSGQPAGFRVIETILRADPFEYSGSCPVVVNFSGRISVVGGGGNVSYKFLRSDGASAPVQTVSFSSPGSKGVSTTWRLGGPGFSYSGWQAIQIFEPQETKSEEAHFSIRCQ